MSATRSTYPPVVVLLGGPSAEHDVSVVSGTAIADALVGDRRTGDDRHVVLRRGPAEEHDDGG